MMMFQTLARVMTSPVDTLHIACGACGHEAAWSRADAFKRLGPDATPVKARERLRCAVCGDTRRVRLWI
jgi:hypothetical protein